MKKSFLAVLLLVMSFLSMHVYARDCSSGYIYATYDGGQPANSYDSSRNDAIVTLKYITGNNFTCSSDYLDPLTMKQWSQLIFRVDNGATCSNGTITIPGKPGVVWQLVDMRCQGSTSVISNTEQANTGNNVNWTSNTYLGKVKLVLTDDYWKRNTQNANLQVYVPLTGATVTSSPNLTVMPMGALMVQNYNIIHSGTCSINVSPENVAFGKISPLDINKGTINQSISINYSCINKALAANGLTFIYKPENIVNANQGTFSAIDNDGKKLNFKLVDYNSSNGQESDIPLNSNVIVNTATVNNVSSSKNLRIKVLPSSPYPTGSLSTYLTITAKYR